MTRGVFDVIECQGGRHICRRSPRYRSGCAQQKTKTKNFSSSRITYRFRNYKWNLVEDPYIHYPRDRTSSLRKTPSLDTYSLSMMTLSVTKGGQHPLEGDVLPLSRRLPAPRSTRNGPFRGSRRVLPLVRPQVPRPGGTLVRGGPSLA